MHHLIIMIFFLSLLSGCVGKPPQKESFIPHSSVSDAHNKKYPSDKDAEIKHQKIIDQIREDIIGKEAWFNSKVCSDIEIKKSDLPINKKFNLSNDYFKIRFLDMRILFEISEESSLIQFDIETPKGEGYFTKKIDNKSDFKIANPPGKKDDCFFKNNPWSYLDDLNKCEGLCAQMKVKETLEYNQKIKNYTPIAEFTTSQSRHGSGQDKTRRSPIKNKPKTQSKPKPKIYDETCSCSSSTNCVGPRGGTYCITSGGNKRYR